MSIRNITMGIAAVTVSAIALNLNIAHATQPVVGAVEQAVDGKDIYMKSCKECHGVLGAPTKASLRKYEKIQNFTDSSFFTKRKDSELIEAIDKGKGRDMKGFSEKLSKEEIHAVMLYIHTLAKKA